MSAHEDIVAQVRQLRAGDMVVVDTRTHRLEGSVVRVGDKVLSIDTGMDVSKVALRRVTAVKKIGTKTSGYEPGVVERPTNSS